MNRPSSITLITSKKFCGIFFITNAGDEDFILEPADQRLVAQCIHQLLPMPST